MTTNVDTLRYMVERKYDMDVNRIGSYVSRCTEDGTSSSHTALESSGGLWICSMSQRQGFAYNHLPLSSELGPSRVNLSNRDGFELMVLSFVVLNFE